MQRLLGPDDFVMTPVVTPSGHARHHTETEAWLRPMLRRVPITRVADLTPLDALGLPVYAAVTPLGRDLTVHTGKGRTPLAARLSAIMEAIERTSAESVAPERVLRASYRALCDAPPDGLAAIDPEALDLPFATRYHPEREISWIVGYDLLAREHALVPLDAVISPPAEGVCLGVETNGLAAGNNHTEAVVHALYELVERDAAAEEAFAQRHAEAGDRDALTHRRPWMIATETLPAEALPWVERIARAGLALTVQEMTGDVDIPTYQAYLVDPHFPGGGGKAVGFGGAGCDLLPSRAVFRAVSETVQAHAAMLLGARDDFEGMAPPPDRGETLRRYVELCYPTELRAMPEDPPESGDLLEDMERILAHLHAAGVRRCVVCDLTRPELGVPVVRVIAPGLSAPYGVSGRRPSLRLLGRLVG